MRFPVRRGSPHAKSSEVSRTVARAPNPPTKKRSHAPSRRASLSNRLPRAGTGQREKRALAGTRPGVLGAPGRRRLLPSLARGVGFPRPGILTGFPFTGRRLSEKRRHSKAARPPFRNGSLASHRGSRETLLHVGPQGSHSCCRYFHQDLHQGRVHPTSQRGFGPTPAPSYSWLCLVQGPGRRMRGPLQRHPFSGPQSSAGELLHTP